MLYEHLEQLWLTTLALFQGWERERDWHEEIKNLVKSSDEEWEPAVLHLEMEFPT